MKFARRSMSDADIRKYEARARRPKRTTLIYKLPPY